ncbi:kinase inhibitor [Pararhizobium polonicum]|uniref:Kinase inhibitor n=1 Tax=Pararhizobium polonicum TaxID=1612624 RepID=A0A1C7NUZ7_9HYPH|nr:YbhB/YbcL family Raf kinase inhibitor-like protein [Pararhizobium polonicum]OBZ92810.1 kinase inhibitor [Pararhizobium polonicum]
MLYKTRLASLVLACAMTTAASAQDFQLSSTSISEGAQLASSYVFAGFGCEGGNQSPQLSWSGAPEGTKSFAITAYDPDAPTGSGWWHWNTVNIPASVNSVELGASGTGAMPTGAVEITNDYGSAGFGGACPPPGEVHRYIFTVHALAVERLELPATPSNALVGFMIHANTIQKAQITAVYNR